jgi:hypothetical protein
VDVVHFKIADLGVTLTPTESHIHFSVPPCYNKFMLPARKLQLMTNGELFKHQNLMLKTEQIIPYEGTPSDVLICGSETWQLWQNESDDYSFMSLNQNPAFRIMINADFSQGKISGDFSSIAKMDIYPLQFIDMRIFSAWLGSLGDIILHASGFMLDGRGYCFIGHSGIGKSTLIRKLAQSNKNITVLGEDQVILRYINNRFWIYGTPWHLDCEMCDPGGAPLEKVFVLTREGEPRITKCRPVEGVTSILETAVIPYYNPNWVSLILNHLDLLAQRIPFYLLRYQLESNPWPLILENEA